MISEKLLEKVNIFMSNLDDRFNWLNLSKREKIMSHSIKLIEEVWELNSEILIKLWRARKQKIDNYNETNLENEFADVLLSVLILSKELDIDINKSITNKINKINKRWWI